MYLKKHLEKIKVYLTGFIKEVFAFMDNAGTIVFLVKILT